MEWDWRNSCYIFQKWYALNRKPSLISIFSESCFPCRCPCTKHTISPDVMIQKHQQFSHACSHANMYRCTHEFIWQPANKNAYYKLKQVAAQIQKSRKYLKYSLQDVAVQKKNSGKHPYFATYKATFLTKVRLEHM